MASRARPPDCCSFSPPPDLAPDRRHRLVALHRALGDATRTEVLRLIAAQAAPGCVCDIIDRFDASQRWLT